MVTFGATAELSVPDSEIERARQEIEDGLDVSVSVGADATQPTTAATGGGVGETMVDLDEERNDLLEDILDELEGGALGGGGGGGLGGLGGGLVSGAAGGASAGGLGVGGIAGAAGLGAVLGLGGTKVLEDTGALDWVEKQGEGLSDAFGSDALEAGLLSGGLVDLGAISKDIVEGDLSFSNLQQIQAQRLDVIGDAINLPDVNLDDLTGGEGLPKDPGDDAVQRLRTQMVINSTAPGQERQEALEEAGIDPASVDPTIGPGELDFLGPGMLAGVTGDQDPLFGPGEAGLTINKPDWLPIDAPPEPDYIDRLETLQQETDRAITAPIDTRTGLPTTPDAERPGVRPPQAETPEPPDANIDVQSEVTVTVEDQRDVEQEVEQEIDDAKRDIKRDLKNELRRI